MSSCVDNVCGTGYDHEVPGGGVIPAPGDPDNNISIAAVTISGGIKVTWSYPVINPNAVAHSLLYRNTTSNFNTAVQIGVVAGSIHYDQLNPTVDTQYFYWVQIVAISGTVMPTVGPASAYARPKKADTLEDLSGSIDESFLAVHLRQDIDKITLNYSELLGEIGDRIASNEALSAALAAVQSGLEESLAFVNQEIITRQSGDNALASQITTIAAVNQSNAAAIIAEQTARVTADSALARSTELIAVATGNNAAAIDNERLARTNADSSLAQQISTTQSTLNGNIASVQQTMQTQINTTNGRVTEIGALWSARVSVNGLVGGFGIYNNGQYVDAGFDVDRFWIGRSNSDRVRPFVVNNGVVYIDDAQIRNASITGAKIQNLAVDTLQIAGNAVTVPAGATLSYDAGGQGIVLQITVVSQGAPIWLFATAEMYVQGGGSYQARVLINGGSVKEWSGSGGNEGASGGGSYGTIIYGTGYSTTISMYLLGGVMRSGAHIFGIGLKK